MFAPKQSLSEPPSSKAATFSPAGKSATNEVDHWSVRGATAHPAAVLSPEGEGEAGSDQALPRFGWSLSQFSTEKAASCTLHRRAATTRATDSDARGTRCGQHPTHESEAPAIVYDTLHEPGQALPASAKAQMEPLFGLDLSRVRIHTGARAAASASAVEADAYTVGSHIAFARGRFDPESGRGRALLAHELTHTLQSAGSASFLGGSIPVGRPDTAQERQAEEVAREVGSGRRKATNTAFDPLPMRGLNRMRLQRSRVVGIWDVSPEPANDQRENYVPLPDIGREPRWNRSQTDDTGVVTLISARTRPEWIEFLKKDADHPPGSLELYAFMMKATGSDEELIVLQHTDLSEPYAPLADDGEIKVLKPWANAPPATTTSAGPAPKVRPDTKQQLTIPIKGSKRFRPIAGGPTHQEAVDLMVALLSTGSKIDLPDKVDEGDNYSIPTYAEMLTRFTAQFSGEAVQQMTPGKDGSAREFDRTDVSNIAEFGREAKNWKGTLDHTKAHKAAPSGFSGEGLRVLDSLDTPNPATALAAAALGTAFGAMTQYIQAGLDPKLQTYKSDAGILLHNAAKTIRGSMDALEEPQGGVSSVLLVAFSAAANGLAAASGYGKVPVQIVSWGLAALASAWLGTLSSPGHDVKDEIRGLKDDFHRKVNEIKTVNLSDGTTKPIDSASDKDIVKNTFDSELSF